MKPLIYEMPHQVLAAIGDPGLVPPILPVDACRRIPIVDHAVLTLMECVMEADEFAMMMQVSVQQYAEYVANLRASMGDAARVRRQAHTLKGSAGSVGFSRLCAFARATEEYADDAAMLAKLVAELERALRSTRAELVALGMLEEPLPQA